MKTGKKISPFIDFYQEDRAQYLADYNNLSALVASNDIKYGKEALWCETTPIVISATERQQIIWASESIIAAAEIFTKLVLASPAWQATFDWSDDFWQLVLADPGYSYNLPCTRFDSFINHDQLTFIELNTDGCSGMTNIDTFHRLYDQTIKNKTELALGDYYFDQVVPNVIATLIDCYAQFRKNKNPEMIEKPVIGILDWGDEHTNWEFIAFAQYCQAAGYQAHVIDPRDAKYEDGVLYFKDQKIDLIYRRLLGVDYAKNLALLKPISDAYLAGDVCMVGSLRSEIPFSKKLFAHLHNPVISKELGPKLSQAVADFIPWTKELVQGPSEYKDQSIDLIPFIKENKDFFVIKPCVSKCGIGIYQGIYTDQAVWEKAIDDALPKDFIVQQFVNIPLAQYPRFTEQEYEPRYIHLGEYVFAGKFSGILGRTCADPLLNLRHGERLLAVLYAK